MKQIIILYSGSTDQKSLTHIIDGDNINIMVREDGKATELFTGDKFSMEKYGRKVIEENNPDNWRATI